MAQASPLCSKRQHSGKLCVAHCAQLCGCYRQSLTHGCRALKLLGNTLRALSLEEEFPRDSPMAAMNPFVQSNARGYTRALPVYIHSTRLLVASSVRLDVPTDDTFACFENVRVRMHQRLLRACQRTQCVW
jgi:hypothetical protein